MTTLFVKTKLTGLWKVKAIAYIGFPLVFVGLLKLDTLLAFAAKFIKIELSDIHDNNPQY